MSFQHSCQDISLENNSVLVARCRKADGSWNDSSLDLDDILGNDDGIDDFLSIIVTVKKILTSNNLPSPLILLSYFSPPPLSWYS